jgi:TPR repeat protein
VDGGQITAMNNLAVMLARGHGTEPDIDKARLLFSRAAETGSKLASENLVTYGAANPDRTKRMQSLRATLLIQTLGMQKDEGVAFLAKNGLISDPKASDESDRHERHQYLFKADGLMLDVDLNGRIMEVEGYDRGAHGSEQRFRGELPLGLTWDTRARSALQTLGDPYDQGYVKWDEAYGLAYRIDNVIFVALFSYEGESGLKVMRVYERWATKYPPPQLPDHGK